MPDPFYKDFADQLKRSDQQVSVDSVGFARQLAQARARRRKTKQQRIALAIVVPVAALLVAVAADWRNSKPGRVGPDIRPDSVVLKQKTAPIGSDIAIVEVSVDFESDRVLNDARAKLRAIESEIQSLRESRSSQDWMIAREVVSRTEFNADILSNYKF